MNDVRDPPPSHKNFSALTLSTSEDCKHSGYRKRRQRDSSFVASICIFMIGMTSVPAFSNSHRLLSRSWSCAPRSRPVVVGASHRWLVMSEISPRRPRSFLESLSSLQMISATTIASTTSTSSRIIKPITDPHHHLQTRTPIANLFDYETTLSSSVPSRTRACCHQIFDLELPEGRCIGLRLQELSPIHPDALTPDAVHHPDHWIHSLLHPQEVQYGMSEPSEQARISFFLGRLAMREILLRNPRHVNTMASSILKDEHGRPQVPKGYLGSISHKRTVGVALVAADVPHAMERPQKGIGVDIEQTFSRHRSIAKKVLTEHEMNNLGKLPGVTHDEEVLLRFSLKESLYKAMHPLICQYVGFQEAEVTPHADGTASMEFQLKSGAHEMFETVTAHWRRLDCGEFFLTSASVSLRQDKNRDDAAAQKP